MVLRGVLARGSTRSGVGSRFRFLLCGGWVLVLCEFPFCRDLFGFCEQFVGSLAFVCSFMMFPFLGFVSEFPFFFLISLFFRCFFFVGFHFFK